MTVAAVLRGIEYTIKFSRYNSGWLARFPVNAYFSLFYQLSHLVLVYLVAFPIELNACLFSLHGSFAVDVLFHLVLRLAMFRLSIQGIEIVACHLSFLTGCFSGLNWLGCFPSLLVISYWLLFRFEFAWLLSQFFMTCHADSKSCFPLFLFRVKKTDCGYLDLRLAVQNVETRIRNYGLL